MSKKLFSFIAIALAASLISTAAVEVYYATKYHTQVKIIKGRNKVGINPLPDSLDFGDLTRAGKQTKFITLTNKSGRNAYMFVYIKGAISPFIKLKKTWFTLKAKKSKKIGFEMSIPASANYEEYEGTVYIFKFPKLF